MPPSCAIAPGVLDSGRQDALEALAGAARIPTDKDALALASQAEGAPETSNEIGRERLAGDPTYAVRTEVRSRGFHRSAVALALRELRPLAGLLEASLLALHLARVTRQEPLHA